MKLYDLSQSQNPAGGGGGVDRCSIIAEPIHQQLHPAVLTTALTHTNPRHTNTASNSSKKLIPAPCKTPQRNNISGGTKKKTDMHHRSTSTSRAQ